MIFLIDDFVDVLGLQKIRVRIKGWVSDEESFIGIDQDLAFVDRAIFHDDLVGHGKSHGKRQKAKRKRENVKSKGVRIIRLSIDRLQKEYSDVFEHISSAPKWR